jgi:3-oxoacyl-[acyl-carrier protein] reductase
MNKTVLVTGASRGIGRATALLFGSKGYHVIINYHANETAAKELLQTFRDNNYSGMIFRADVSDETQVKNMIAAAEKQFGMIDILVNNAGIAWQKLFTDITTEEWNRMFAVHVNGTFFCCRAVLPNMIAQKNGRIINLSSMWGITGASCEVPYSAAKAAIIGLTKALAKEVGPSNITVNSVAPGVIGTEMNDDLDDEALQILCDKTPLCRFGTADEVARAIYFLASEDADFITGQVLSPNGGFVI